MTRPGRDLRLAGGWVVALFRRRAGITALTGLGVALAVALLAALGAFLSSSKTSMTRRAIESVSVDWQLAVQPGADPATVASAVASDAHVTGSEPVLFAAADSLSSTTAPSTAAPASGGGESASVVVTTHSTGAAQVLGFSDSYQHTFPGEIRTLIGASSGVLVFQQTAANLAVGPGDAITIARAGLPSVPVTVAGVVELPSADSLFQDVGARVGSQPHAPPDNVVLLPIALWHQLFDPLAAGRADLVRQQIHVRVDHHLASDPAAAYQQVIGEAHNLEVRLAGAAIVGNNVGAALDAARSDALYAQVLFLFLGAPGAILAGVVTFAVASAGRTRRRHEQALLRARGATVRQLALLGVTEAATVGVAGGAVGLGLAAMVGRALFGTSRFGASSRAAATWAFGAIAIGLVVAAGAIALPAWRDARELTVAGARRTIGRARSPRWMRWGLDVIMLGLAGLVFWSTSRNGYQLVLAPEGVPTISVSYWAFAGPVLLWIGSGLFAYRLTCLLAGRGRAVLRAAFTPVSGPLADTVAASLQRQQQVLAAGASLIALTVGFAVSTAVFNATYRQQAEVDAVLSNGADVTVTTPPGATVGPPAALATSIAATPGVQHVEALQHRYAYVGADLQDLYGVNPTTIVGAGRLQDAYFQGGSARRLMSALAAQPDNILVSAETVKDFQLQAGDQLTLRLQDGRSKQYVQVPFHYAGVVHEFPTAARDSFLLANAAYITQVTGTDTVGAFLVDTGGKNISRIADALRARVGVTATVGDLVSSRKVVGSSLTAIDLHGLTRLELAFAVVLAAAATGLTLWLGFHERRRTFTIAAALGARRRQLAGFVWAEVIVVVGAGLAAGAIAAWALSSMLVTVLHGVFDPAPSHLAVPWSYLAIVLAVSAASTTFAAVATVRTSRRPQLELLHAL